MISDYELDNTIVTALIALKILTQSRRQVDREGNVSLLLGKDANMTDDFDNDLMMANSVLKSTTPEELAARMEIRILELHSLNAHKRLQNIRGSNGK